MFEDHPSTSILDRILSNRTNVHRFCKVYCKVRVPILAYALANAGGSHTEGHGMTPGETTLQNGGGTFDARTLEPVAPTSGYAVGIAQATAERVPWWMSRTAWDIDQAIARVREAYPTAPYIGTWDDNGTVCIDPVIILPDRESAVIVARAFGQVAVWDFTAGAEVFVGSAGTLPAEAFR